MLQHEKACGGVRTAAAVALAAALTLACGREGGQPADTWTVEDEAGVLSREQLRSIADYLEFVVSERAVDYRVVVIDDGAVDLVEEGVVRYERMHIASRLEGQGLLLLVDVGAGAARVEVGYGLEHRVRDVEASSMISDYLAPYFASGNVAAGIEASVERLVGVLDASPEEDVAAPPALGSGGAGATAELFAGIDALTPETEARLRRILVPQARPEDCVRLEIALMHRGIYYGEAPMYDEAWRRATRRRFSPQRLRSIAREWDGPFEIERRGDHAITYFTGQKGVRFGPQFLRRTRAGWIVDASLVARYIVYDYSSTHWFAVEDQYPYLELIQSVYPMGRITLTDGRPAWMIGAADGGDG